MYMEICVMESLPYFKCDAPPGRSGDWLLERFEVQDSPRPEDVPHMLDCARSRDGTFSRLKCGSEVFMTDLYDEWSTQEIAIQQALQRGGHVLISGLGLGLILESIFRAPRSPVRRITVLEKSPDVVSLMAPHLLERYKERLEIIEADVFAWEPPEGARYSVVWHDIWPNPQAPEVEGEMVDLQARYGAHGDWHGSWPQEWLWVYEKKPWDRGLDKAVTL